MGLHYLAFIRRNLEDRMKLTLIGIMNNSDMNSTNIMNHASIFNDSVAMNNIFSK